MKARDRRALKAAAGEVLQAPTGKPKRLVLIYVGAMAALSLISAAVSFFLNNQISDTGGLSGLGLRSVLQTADQVLSLTVSVLPIFWSMGFLFCLLKLTRRQETGDADLFQGFRYFGPVLRLSLLRSLFITLIAMGAFSLASTVMSFTPLAAPAYELLLPILGEDPAAMDLSVLDEATMVALTDAMIPVIIGCVVICAAVLLPVAYRLRLSDYFLLDNPREGAIAAMVRSSRAMRGHGWQLVGLDLSFWWYYLAEVALMALAYGQLLLELLGITLPFSSEAVFFGFYVLTLALQTVLYYFVLLRVELSYVLFYEALRLEKMSPPVQNAQGRVPWNTQGE